MALATATITFDLADWVGDDLDARRTRGYITTNAPEGYVTDTTAGKIRVDDAKVTVNSDGTGTVTAWKPGAGANPATWQTTFHFDVPRNGRRDRTTLTMGPFTITADANLASLIEEQVAIPTATAADYASAAGSSATAAAGSATAAAGSATAAATAKTAAEAARDDTVTISGLTGEDAAVGVLVAGTAGAGPLTRAALSTTIAEALAADETVIQAAANAAGYGWLEISATAPSRPASVTTTNASATITAAAATFGAADIGAPIVGAGIPDYTTITAVASSTSATMSHNATASGTPAVTIGIIAVDAHPVVWITPSEVLTPILVNPPIPTWNDATGQITIPSGVVGVDYVWTSGGGGVGATVTQGSTVSTSGTYPRSVVITPVPKPGYVLATSGQTFLHDFPDPTALTVVTSDGFSGTAGTAIAGRATDVALGGSPITPTLNGGTTPWVLDSSGRMAMGTVASENDRIQYAFTGTKNVRVEFDLVSFSGGTNRTFTVEIWEVGGTGGVVTANFGAGSQPLSTVPSPVAPARPTPVVGHYVVQFYVSTFSITEPGGVTSSYTLPTPWTSSSRQIWLRAGTGGATAVIDNLKISKVGF